MNVTLLDTRTGETVEVAGVPEFQWLHGNWTCDCNRELEFGHDTAVNTCLGAKRYLVIRAARDTLMEGFLEEEGLETPSLKELNREYPEGLLRGWGIVGERPLPKGGKKPRKVCPHCLGECTGKS